MDFFYDVVDCVGGYPYEYGSIDEIKALCEPLGLTMIRATHAQVPTGCNELVFSRSAAELQPWLSTEARPLEPDEHEN